MSARPALDVLQLEQHGCARQFHAAACGFARTSVGVLRVPGAGAVANVDDDDVDVDDDDDEEDVDDGFVDDAGDVNVVVDDNDAAAAAAVSVVIAEGRCCGRRGTRSKACSSQQPRLVRSGCISMNVSHMKRGGKPQVLEEAALVNMEGRPTHSSSLGPSKVPAPRLGGYTIRLSCLAGESTKCVEDAL